MNPKFLPSNLSSSSLVISSFTVGLPTTGGLHSELILALSKMQTDVYNVKYISIIFEYICNIQFPYYSWMWLHLCRVMISVHATFLLGLVLNHLGFQLIASYPLSFVMKTESKLQVWKSSYDSQPMKHRLLV